MGSTKKCRACGSMVDINSNFCNNCGGADFEISQDVQNSYVGTDAQNPQPFAYGEPLQYEQYKGTAGVVPPEEPKHENVMAGIAGAFVFSIIGALVYFVIYQIGVIAGISGFIMFFLASFGYGLFSGVRGTNSKACIITSIILTVIMIFVAEYISVSFEVYRVFKDEFGFTFIDAVRVMPDLLSDPEISGAFIKDLLFAYALGAIATVGTIVSKVRTSKMKNGTLK